jgi:hypothetical protein
MEIPLLKKLVANLVNAQRDPKFLASEIEKFSSTFYHAPEDEDAAFPKPIFDVLADLAMDLEHYVADPKARAEDPSYFGDEKAMEKIKAALKRLKDLGIDVDSLH